MNLITIRYPKGQVKGCTYDGQVIGEVDEHTSESNIAPPLPRLLQNEVRQPRNLHDASGPAYYPLHR